MKIRVSTPDEVAVSISDDDGYSPDKLDDWVARAVQFVVVERQTRLHMFAMERELFGDRHASEEVSVELGEGDPNE